MLFLLLLISVASAAQRVTCSSHNVLEKPYNVYPLGLPSDQLYLFNDTLRLGRNLDVMYSQSGVSVFAYQEVSDDTPCLNNESYILQGSYPFIKSAVEARGYACFFAANDMTYWSKYFDYDRCDVQQSWMLSGNVLCLNTTDYSDIVFFAYRLSSGSMVAAANATLRGEVPVVVASIHIDSDVAGIRRKEFKDLRARFSPYGDRLVMMMGDFNTGWETNNLQTEFAESGYVDVVWEMKKNTSLAAFSYRSQPLTNVWYGSNNHVDWPIDHVLVSPARTRLVQDIVLSGQEALHGYPNVTLTGIIDFKQWTTYPEIYSHDTNEAARIAANLRASGSDHYPVMATFDILY